MRDLCLLAGANTAQGFYSFYHDLARDSFHQVYILKGGPGSGKSTLLKNLAAALKDHGICKFYCSADPQSLDGIYIADLETAVLDGTAPHIVDPRLPGAVQHLVDLGQYWDTDQLSRRRGEIRTLAAAISRQYRIAYKWLEIAGACTELEQLPTRTESQARSDAAEVCRLLPETARGHSWHAFATAITGQGLVNLLPRLAQGCPTVIALAGGNRQYNNMFLQTIAAALADRNLAALYLHCALQPQYVEHILIPGKIGIFSVHPPHELARADYRYGRETRGTAPVPKQLCLDQAVAAMAEAARFHKELEKIYVPAVDFARVKTRESQLLAEITTRSQ